ncbi:unnamed protein product [Cyclocybe aegerita]|uniref:Rho GTPase activation protein n=1 Tax=Cyclocybe aegerita TaxID=1973307 RepID=A0A8S0WKX4_CYCAE|nr:unnamed protein product [Cyclocybe aegerita]
MPPPSFNLKQKLAALSLGPSGPSSPHSPSFGQMRNGNGHDIYAASPTSPTGKRKFFNPQSWLKKSQEAFGTFRGERGEVRLSYDEEERRMVQEVLGKMIFQAGVDFETRPMVVLNASALPDPEVVSYDLLLARILSYLDLYVEADYTVVFFAAGSKHAPNWNWVWKAYRSLSRKYRKNLKLLYIVHSSFFSKMLFSLAGAIISPKFFRKLTYITTLSELAEHVPITQIDISPAVYQENLKHERKIKLLVPIRSSTFGVPLEDIMGYDGEKGGIPRVVRDAIQFLRDSGMQDEGLFRRSPSSALLRAAQDAYDRGNVVSLETFGDPHLAAVLIKKYLRDLPEPIFPESTYSSIRRCPIPVGSRPQELDHEAELAAVQYVRDVILPELVPCAYILLSNVLHLLHDVSLRSATNRMDAFNLAIVVSPNLVKSPNPIRDVMMCSVPVPTAVAGLDSDMSTSGFSNAFHPDDGADAATSEGKTTLGMVIALCIRRYYEIFDEVVDRSEAIPPWRALRNQGIVGDGTSDGSGSPKQPTYVLGDEEDLDDDFDADGHPHPASPTHQHISAAAGSSNGRGTKRHKNTLSNASSARSPFRNSISSSPSAWNTNSSSGATTRAAPSSLSPPKGQAYPTHGKAKSMISIEKSGLSSILANGTAKRGSIAIGRGTTRKGSGAAVEAVSVTAEGFFTPPGGESSIPPVPKLPPRVAEFSSSTAFKSEAEEPVLSLSERRKIFEGGT